MTLTTARRWHREKTFHHGSFPPERLRAERSLSATVCVPAREEAATIAAVIGPLVALREQGVIDQVLVVDADSADGTGAIAAGVGADVRSQGSLLPEHGPVLGKGDALWRALSACEGDVVAFVDADSSDFGAHFACGLLGPLLCAGGEELAFVKGFYRRPFRTGDEITAHGGGRVTELVARPLLNAFYPELAGVLQPLAGEIGARRELLERLPFETGYAVETAMLLDVHAEVGLAGMAQVDLDVRQNEHQPLAALSVMAFHVLSAVARRLRREGRLDDAQVEAFLAQGAGGLEEHDARIVERPPLASLRVQAG